MQSFAPFWNRIPKNEEKHGGEKILVESRENRPGEAPFSNLIFFVKNREKICDWINEYSLIRSQTLPILHFFLRIFDEIFPGFRAKFQKIVTCVAFSIKFAKTKIRNLPKILNFVKIIHSYSKLFTGVLTGEREAEKGRGAGTRSCPGRWPPRPSPVCGGA